MCVCVCVQLRQEWEIARQEVMLVHSEMVSQYRENRSGLQVSPIPIPPVSHSHTLSHRSPPQAQLEAGVTFKKSTAKGVAELDFVPVNLHIQQMKVKTEAQDRGEWTAECSCSQRPPPCLSPHREGGLHVCDCRLPDRLQPQVQTWRPGQATAELPLGQHRVSSHHYMFCPAPATVVCTSA